MKLFYDLSIHVYNWLITAARMSGNKKASLIAAGRAETFDKIASFKKSTNAPVALFHCASLGEFEQARPVIESWKKSYPAYKIAVSFFSPSGYEIRKNYAQADLIVYLPADTQKQAFTFIQELSPAVVFIVKYEFWLNLLDAIKAQHIPLYLISGVFRKKLLFFRKGGDFMRERLKAFSHFFLQDNTSGDLLSSIGFNNWSISGDTRFDRVQQTARAAIKIEEIELFKQQQPLLVIGSGWKEDMAVLIPFINSFKKELKIIFAPHEIHDAEITAIQKQITKKSIRFSALKKDSTLQADVLIIDNIGMLSSIYSYADFAYVGGAFGNGLHNILEPAVFGAPIFFGPNIKKFPEAAWLISLGYANSITDTETFSKLFTAIYDTPVLKESIKKGLQSSMLQACGATDHIMNKLATDFSTASATTNTPT